MLEGFKLITRVSKLAPLSDYLLEAASPANADTMNDEEIKEWIKDCERLRLARRVRSELIVMKLWRRYITLCALARSVSLPTCECCQYID